MMFSHPVFVHMQVQLAIYSGDLNVPEMARFTVRSVFGQIGALNPLRRKSEDLEM